MPQRLWRRWIRARLTARASPSCERTKRTREQRANREAARRDRGRAVALAVAPRAAADAARPRPVADGATRDRRVATAMVDRLSTRAWVRRTGDSAEGRPCLSSRPCLSATRTTDRPTMAAGRPRTTTAPAAAAGARAADDRPVAAAAGVAVAAAADRDLRAEAAADDDLDLDRGRAPPAPAGDAAAPAPAPRRDHAPDRALDLGPRHDHARALVRALPAPDRAPAPVRDPALARRPRRTPQRSQSRVRRAGSNVTDAEPAFCLSSRKSRSIFLSLHSYFSLQINSISVHIFCRRERCNAACP